MDDFSKTLMGLSALAQDTRLRVFRYLMKATPEGIQAGKISEELNVAPNKLSAHLTILVNAGLLSVERDGRRMIYKTEIGAVSHLISMLVETCCDNNPSICKALNQATQQSCKTPELVG
ncbi:ArsR/SmtB family transcription factor [Ponticaulis profundi]|uniref:ArsR/SmtB family transcription factor n=1 Tax=Ponticaulis profundi TaxID=2665222 RepID=A0ABW1SC17_9PROT